MESKDNKPSSSTLLEKIGKDGLLGSIVRGRGGAKLSKISSSLYESKDKKPSSSTLLEKIGKGALYGSIAGGGLVILSKIVISFYGFTSKGPAIYVVFERYS